MQWLRFSSPESSVQSDVAHSALDRFPQINLEKAMVAHDIAMHILERRGQGAEAEIRLYPLNPAAEVGFGDFRERQGLRLEDYLHHPDYESVFREHWRPVLDDGAPVHIYSMTFPDAQQEPRDFVVRVHTIEWSAEYAQAISLAIDVTEHNRTLATLHRTQAQLRSVVEHAPGILFMIDQDGICTLSEGKGLSAFGLQAGQAVGQSAFDMYRDMPQICTDLRRVLGGETFASVQSFGPMVWEAQYAPIYDNQQIIGAVGISNDITAREQLKETIIRSQALALEELSTPLIPITDTIVVMPLIGALDSARAQKILTTMLDGVQAQRARVAILDITGVPVVDSQVANVLIGTAKAVKLLGTQLILTGIRPEIAQTLIGLGIDLAGIITQATLQNGIAYALRRHA